MRWGGIERPLHGRECRVHSDPLSPSSAQAILGHEAVAVSHLFVLLKLSCSNVQRAYLLPCRARRLPAESRSSRLQSASGSPWHPSRRLIHGTLRPHPTRRRRGSRHPSLNASSQLVSTCTHARLFPCSACFEFQDVWGCVAKAMKSKDYDRLFR